MKKLILLLVLLNSGICYSQSQDSLGILNSRKDTLKLAPYLLSSLQAGSTWTVSSDFNFKLPKCLFTVENALKDIRNDSMKIVIHGGFVGFGDIDKVRSDAFQKKYNIQFEYVGCFRSWDIKTEDTYGYNDKIFEYLVGKHGDGVKEEFKAIWN